ncbi:MAG: carbohydrate kinase family protein [Rhodospirillales bacterium]|nr:carbohydrate kinase family protein [Rhodospirillales bacterium]
MRALCIGSAVVDTIVLVADRNVERMTMHNATSSFLLLEQGVKIDTESITSHIGGGAVNAGVSMARLGIDVTALIKIGNDHSGEKVLACLTRENVRQTHVLKTDELSTGTSVMVSSHDRNATIFTQRGTNTLLLAEDVAQNKFSGFDLVYVTNLSNRSADCFPLIVDAGHAQGAFIAVNPGIRQLTSRASPFLNSLAKINLLAVNRVEAESLVPALIARAQSDAVGSLHHSVSGDEPRLMRLGLSFGGFDMELMDFFREIRKTGVGRVLVTDGIEGSYLADEQGVHHCPALRIEPKGTAGAGDAFISTLSGFIAMEEAASLALRAAAVNAAGVVSEIDTQSGLMRRDDLDAAISGNLAALPITTWAW